MPGSNAYLISSSASIKTFSRSDTGPWSYLSVWSGSRQAGRMSGELDEWYKSLASAPRLAASGWMNSEGDCRGQCDRRNESSPHGSSRRKELINLLRLLTAGIYIKAAGLSCDSKGGLLSFMLWLESRPVGGRRDLDARRASSQF